MSKADIPGLETSCLLVQDIQVDFLAEQVTNFKLDNFSVVKLNCWEI